MQESRDKAEYGDIEIKQMMRVKFRQIHERVDVLYQDNDVLLDKYRVLLKENLYYAVLAESMIKIMQLSSSLLAADERDKESISLIGEKGPTDLH